MFKNDCLEIKLKYKHHLSIHTNRSKQDEKVAWLVLLLVKILLTTLDYMIIAPFLPLKPKQLILHFIISEINLKNNSSFIQILFLY